MMQTGIVSDVLFKLGLPYQVRPSGKVRVAPSGMFRIFAGTDNKLPLPMDRMPLIFMLSHARENLETVSFRYRDIVAWCNKSWRDSEVRERVERLLSCRIEQMTAEGWRRYRIADWWDAKERELEIDFATEFQRSARDGREFPLEHLHGLARTMGALDLYLFERWVLHVGEFREYWDPYAVMCSSGEPWSIGARMRQRLKQIEQVCPNQPFVNCDLRFLSCPRKEFYLHARGVDVDALKASMLAEVAGMKRDEFRRYVDDQPIERRGELTALYMEECMAPEAIELTSRPLPVMPDVAGVDVPGRAEEGPTAGCMNGDERETTPTVEAVAESVATVEPSATVTESAGTIEAAEAVAAPAETAAETAPAEAETDEPTEAVTEPVAPAAPAEAAAEIAAPAAPAASAPVAEPAASAAESRRHRHRAPRTRRAGLGRLLLRAVRAPRLRRFVRCPDGEVNRLTSRWPRAEQLPRDWRLWPGRRKQVAKEEAKRPGARSARPSAAR